MKFFKIIFSKPKMSMMAFKLWNRNFLFFKKTILISIFWTVFEPLMYLGAIGFGLGSFVSTVSGHSYIEFFFPALLCTTAMLVPYFECTYGNYAKLTWQKLYHSILMTPVQPQDIAFGEILWGTSKGFFGVIGVVLVASFFGMITSFQIIPGLIVLFLVAWIFSCIGMIVTSFAKNYDSFIYTTSGIIVPMSLFSGTYFPLNTAPEGFRYLFYLSPLTHGVELERNILWGQVGNESIFHFIVLIVLGWTLYNYASYRMIERLKS